MSLIVLGCIYAVSLFILIFMLVYWLREHKIRNFFLLGVIPVLLAVAGQLIFYSIYPVTGALGIIIHIYLTIYLLPLFIPSCVIIAAVTLKWLRKKRRNPMKIGFLYAAIPALYVTLCMICLLTC